MNEWIYVYVVGFLTIVGYLLSRNVLRRRRRRSRGLSVYRRWSEDYFGVPIYSWQARILDEMAEMDEYPRPSVRDVSISPVDPKRAGWWPRG